MPAKQYTGFKVLVEEDTDHLLGAHILGLHAEEVINLFALAIRTGLSATELKQMVYAYPTSASDINYMVSYRPGRGQRRESTERDSCYHPIRC